MLQYAFNCTLHWWKSWNLHDKLTLKLLKAFQPSSLTQLTHLLIILHRADHTSTQTHKPFHQVKVVLLFSGNSIRLTAILAKFLASASLYDCVYVCASRHLLPFEMGKKWSVKWWFVYSHNALKWRMHFQMHYFNCFKQIHMHLLPYNVIVVGFTYAIA